MASTSSSLPTYLVTGASAGVGLSLVERLLEENTSIDGTCSVVVVLGCRNEKKAAEVRNELLKKFPKANIEILAVDVEVMKSAVKAAKEFQARFKRLDVLYLNAGVMPTNGIDWRYIATNPQNYYGLFTTGERALKQVDYVTSEGLQGIFATNLMGHYLMIQELAPLLESTSKIIGEDAKVVWTGSSSANNRSLDLSNIQHVNGFDPYGSSKHGVDTLTVALNDQFKGRGITVYTTCPGLVMSQLTYNFLPPWAWTLLLPLFWLLRLVAPMLNMKAYNGALPLVELHRKGFHPDPIFKRVSCTSPFGRSYVKERSLEDIGHTQALHFKEQLDVLSSNFRK